MKVDLSHGGLVRLAVTVVAVAMVLYHMWVIVAGQPEAIIFRGTHLLFALVLVFLIYGSKVGVQRPIPNFFDYVWLALGVASLLYLFINYEYVITRIYYIDDLTWADMIFGTILIVVVTEATRRCVDLSLPVTSILFLLYGLFIAKLEPMRLLDQLYMTTEGIFGQALAVSASFVIIFVVFGSFMEKTGVGQLFMDFAMALTGHTAGGPGKVSVVSSSLFGTISGSAVANVMVDGPISIPLMKRSGFPPHFAAGVEATASTGGQIMPPIMGAAAFVMAEFLAVPYGQIVIWAVIPGDPLLRCLLCGGAFRGQAPRHRRRAARAAAEAAHRHGRARTPVSPDHHPPGRHVFGLQRAAGGAGGHARLLPGGGAAQVDARQCHAARISSTRWSKGRRIRSRWRSPARPPAS